MISLHTLTPNGLKLVGVALTASMFYGGYRRIVQALPWLHFSKNGLYCVRVVLQYPASTRHEKAGAGGCLGVDCSKVLTFAACGSALQECFNGARLSPVVDRWNSLAWRMTHTTRAHTWWRTNTALLSTRSVHIYESEHNRQCAFQ